MKMKMKRISLLVLLIFAFVGRNLFMGVSFNTGNMVKSPDLDYGSIKLNGRRLQETRFSLTNQKTRSLENVRTDDYQPVDPSPSSKASIRAGPIEHGTPLLPYVPQYTPPPAQSPASPDT